MKTFVIVIAAVLALTASVQAAGISNPTSIARGHR